MRARSTTTGPATGPGLGVNVDNFSARWTGQFPFTGGTYTFSSTTDDGVRVYVDGSLLIDGWHDGRPPGQRLRALLRARTP